MLNILIGHRGTGKSHFLNLLKPVYKSKALFFDLDEEIEKLEKKIVFDLFQQNPLAFRQKERQVFKKILRSLPKNKICFVAVGAGFVFKKNPSWNVIYLGRRSDKAGRIFLNRPRLNLSQNPFEEYKKIYQKRNPLYFKQADECLFRREHFKPLEFSDWLFLGLKKISKPCFSLCLNPKETPKQKGPLKLFLQKRLNWGLRFFELNDQTADEDFIQSLQALVPKDKILFSSQCSKKFSLIKNKKNWSWDLSLGLPPKGVNILSWHKRGKKELKSILEEFSGYKNYHLKLAIEIFSLRELKTAYDWWREEPKKRSFLPRSKEGRWLWFRQAFGPQMLLHFIKERETKIPDQPFLSEAIPFTKRRKALAGILGDPVELSATPAEQNKFFYEQRSIPVLALPLKEAEMTKKNLQILNELGFVFFAVTSPLKRKAFLSAGTRDKASQKFEASNTLIFHQSVWRAFNTDNAGRLKKYSSQKTAVWGGGGIRPVLKKSLPLALFYSARTGQLKEGSGAEKKPLKYPLKKDKIGKPGPKTVIWAVGRKRMRQGCLMPPKHWRPAQVIDINYTEDSPGLEYALQTGANYKSGFKFFKEQAKKQREIFKKLKGV